MIDQEWLDMMPFSCIVQERQSSDGFVGQWTYAPPLTNELGDPPKCHIEYKTGTIQNKEGVTKTQLGIVYLDDSYPIDTTWKLAIPTPAGDREVEIIAVDQNSDEVGWHHTALRFGAL